MKTNFQFGVDYYPEHWPESRWETDAKLMKEMGLMVVRLAEFSWHKMEPSKGHYVFDWLERVLAVLDEHGIKAVLGIPSAAPPAWLIEMHPDILPVDSRGLVRRFGGRHHDCQSNPTYREYVSRMVTAMAKAFGNDPRVVGWQTDNELGNSHEDFCHCGHCAAGFRKWLQTKYGNIDRLNSAWGTYFWSQTYDDFRQVNTPKITPNSHNPSLLLDWKRFHSDLIIDFQRVQVDLLRKKTHGQFITHNFMGFFDVIDYFKLAEPLDFASHDQYPTGYWDIPTGRPPASLAATLDLVAALKRKAFWVMEQQAGPTGWEIMARTPRRGQLALWAAQSIAHGADTVVFFRWRTCSVGTEQYWHGILPHDGKPGRRYEELKKLIKDFAPVMPRFEGSLPRAKVGIIHSYEQNWAIEIQPHHPELEYNSISQDIYRAFYSMNVPAAYLSPNDDLASYDLIVAPLQFLDLPGSSERYLEYIRNGGHMVFTPRTGVKDENNVCLTETSLPGPYAEALGIEILEYDCLRGTEITVPLQTANGIGRYWWDSIELRGARSFFPAGSGDHKDEPSLTGNRYGQGMAWYMATFPDNTLMDSIMEKTVAEAHISSFTTIDKGIEIACRETDEKRYIFVLNHTGTSAKIDERSTWVSLIGGYELSPYGYSLFAENIR